MTDSNSTVSFLFCLPFLFFKFETAHVAFYFVFTSFYGRRLLAIALLSIPVYITISVFKPGAGTTKAKLILLWMFGVCLMVWCTYFLESWKRRSATICQRWGLSDYKADTIEQARAQFDGEMRLGFYCRGGFVPLENAVSAFSNAHIINMGESVASPTTPHEETSTDGEQNEEDVITPEKKEASIPNASTLNLPQSPWKDPGSLRNARFQSWCVTVLFSILMGGLTFLLLWYRMKIRKWAVGVIGATAGNLLPGILNSVLITIFEPIWRKISLQLTRHENRRTNQHYLDSLIYKRFALQFLSNYISLFYIAFVLPFFSKDEKCTIGIDTVGTGVLSILQFDRTKADSQNPNCFAELEVQLGTLIIMRSTIGQINELLVPYLIIQLKRLRMFVLGVDVHYENRNDTNLINNNNANLNNNTNNNNTGVHNDRPILRNVRPNSTGQDGRELSIIERVMSESQRKNLVVSNVNNRYVQESNLMIYESTLDDYNEMVIQFGFICLFGVVFPPVCFVALINNLIEVRTDAYKILRLCQRPTVDNAADIGAWYNILEFLNILSVITNLAILIFTADSLHGLATGLREKTDPWQYVVIMVVFFVVAEHILLGIKFLLAFCIPDVPARINRRYARQQFDIARHFNVGWREAFRGVSLLNVDPRQVALCTKEAVNFDAVSEDGDIV